MSDISVTPLWERSAEDLVKAALKPENAMDLLDLGQHFQGEDYTEEMVEDTLKREAADEAKKISDEKLASNKKKVEAARKARRTSAGKTGRRASIVTGPLGDTGEPEVRRASLGGGA